MPPSPGPSFDLAVKISDLTSASHLKQLLEGNAEPAFKFAAELVPHWGETMDKVPAGTKTTFKLSQDSKWKTSTGVGFGLTASVECDLEVVKKGCCVQYADAIGSDPKAGIPAEDYTGCSYLKLSINFEIDGNISGTGSIGAFGVSGNAKGSAATSLIFAHKVTNKVLLKDAVAETFEKFVFPLQPSCAVDMAIGDVAAVTYNGSLSCSFTLSYGIGKYHFSAPSVKNTLDSVHKGMASLTLPSGTVDIGASVNVGYTHSDDFTAIVHKTDAATVALLLLRAHKNDVTAGGGLTAKINIKQHAGVKLDQQKLGKAFDGITKGHGAMVAAQAQNLQQQLNNKADSWVDNEMKNGASLQATWDRQTSTTLLFKYHVQLTNPALRQSWDYFCHGDIVQAVGAGGLTLDPGSGIDNQLSRSFTINVNFFNFFSVQDVDKYFEDSKVLIADNGTVHFVFDVGKESDEQIKKALQKSKIHFTADASAKTGTDVKLYLELSETQDATEAARMAAVAGYLAHPEAGTAASDIRSFVAKQPAGTVNLTCILDATAYVKLAASEYDGDKPPVDQTQDEKNWTVFDQASLALLTVPKGEIVTYSLWQKWSAAANGTTSANRRHQGNYQGSDASAVWAGQDTSTKILLDNFCWAGSSFMNLCDDLHLLATAANIKIPDDWNKLLDHLRDIVNADVKIAYAKSSIASLLKLSAPSKVDYKKQEAGKTITCTLELS